MSKKSWAIVLVVRLEHWWEWEWLGLSVSTILFRLGGTFKSYVAHFDSCTVAPSFILPKGAGLPLLLSSSSRFTTFSLSFAPSWLNFGFITLEYIFYTRTKLFFRFSKYISAHFLRVLESFEKRWKKMKFEKKGFLRAWKIQVCSRTTYSNLSKFCAKFCQKIVNGEWNFELKTREIWKMSFWLPKPKSATHVSKKLPILCLYSTFSCSFLDINVEFVAKVDYTLEEWP